MKEPMDTTADGGMTRPVVVAPDVTFAVIDTALRELGWTRDPDPYAPAPVIEGEPELASWSRGSQDETRVVYGFNPAVWLRVLSFVGPDATRASEQVGGLLRIVSTAEIGVMLGAVGVDLPLLGVLAAREMGASELLPEIAGLIEHEDETLASEAYAAMLELTDRVTEQGTTWLQQKRMESPGRSILFPQLGGPHERRQIVRWIMRDQAEINDHMVEVLRSALDDPDWEVRVSAMLAVARFGVVQLRSPITRLSLTEPQHPGLDSIDLGILASAREASLAILDGRVDETHLSVAAEAARPAHAHLARCILGLPVKRYDRTFLLVRSLTVPVGETGIVLSPPSAVEKGEADNTYHVEPLGIDFVWVPPVEHWLGDDPALLPAANPIRSQTPSGSGFLIGKIPCSLEVATAFGLGGAVSNASDETWWLESARGAEEACEEMSRLSGLNVTVQTADQWEMAARGTDGRRFPWGVGLESRGRQRPSPWEMTEVVGSFGEWARVEGQGGAPVVVGDTRAPHAAARLNRSPGTRLAFRPVIMV